jgi:PKD repeat protein
MTTSLIRPHYFDRQQLRAADLLAGQEYLRERLRRHNRFLHGWGIVCGVQVLPRPATDAWELSITEGYAVTPLGDEIYIPAGTTFNMKEGVENCLGTESPCPDPTVLVEQSVCVVAARIDPPGKDTSRDYNAEWVDLLVSKTTNLNGFAVQHVINPGMENEGRETYYTFRETTIFPADTLIRIHSGAQREDPDPESGLTHRYRASASEVGNWRLNNTGDTIFILDPSGQEVHSESFLPGSLEPVDLIYLVGYPADEPRQPQPAMPTNCQPAGGVYEFSRICETVQFKVVCELSAFHRAEQASCAEVEEMLCGQAPIPCPPKPAIEDNYVVLARIAVGQSGPVQIDDRNDRRQLLSEALISAYLRCQCITAELPVAGFTADPVSGVAPLNVNFTDRSTGNITGWAWSFGDGHTSSQQNPTHTYETAGRHTITLTVTGPGGSATVSDDITVIAAPPRASFIARPTSGKIPLVVSFEDQSTGEITRWDWSFGDGNVSNERNPVHGYEEEGTFNAELMVSGPGGTDMTSVEIRATAARAILDIQPSVISGGFFETRHTVAVIGIGLEDAVRVRFERSGITVLAINRLPREIPREGILLSIRLDRRATPGSYGFTISFLGDTELSSGDVKLEVNRELIRVGGGEFVIDLEEATFDLDLGREQSIDTITGIGGVRGSRLREAGAENLLALAVMPPERIAQIAGVSVDMATQWREEARQKMRR